MSNSHFLSQILCNEIVLLLRQLWLFSLSKGSTSKNNSISLVSKSFVSNIIESIAKVKIFDILFVVVASWLRLFVRSQRYLLVVFKVSFVLVRRKGGALSKVSAGLAYRPFFLNAITPAK